MLWRTDPPGPFQNREKRHARSSASPADLPLHIEILLKLLDLHIFILCQSIRPDDTTALSSEGLRKVMKSGLQKAALAKLARLTRDDQLPPETQAQLRERLLNRCAEPKKLLPNGVNGVNGLAGSTRIIVFTFLSKFRQLNF